MDPAREFLYRHGGRLAAAERAFPDAARPWIDLSTGVNPSPWRGRRASSGELARLPDPRALAELEVAAARSFGLADPSRIAAVAGAEAALRLLPILTGARQVAIVGPTYGAHAEAWAATGARVQAIGHGTLGAAEAEAVVAVNPNNPDGARLQPAILRDLAARQTRKGGWLIVDESFVETIPELSVAAAAGGGLIVLRSFGKFYGLPGVRLGFVLADPALIARLRALTGDWPVGAEALAAGGAYADPAWAERTRRRLLQDADRLDRLLQRAGFEVVGGTSLFRLARVEDAGRRFERLARRGVLTRPFSYRSDWLRFGLPPARAWPRLKAALEAAS